MKFLFVHNLYEPLARGGAETFVKNLALASDDEVVIATTGYKTESHRRHEAIVYTYKSDFWSLDKMDFIQRMFWHLTHLYNYSAGQYLAQIIKKEKPDIVVTNNLIGYGLSTWSVISRSGCKHVHIMHDVQLLWPSGLIVAGKEAVVDNPLAKLYQLYTRCLARNLSCVVSPSNWLLDWHRTRGFFSRSKTIVLPQPRHIRPSDGKLKYDKQIFKLLYVGQLEKHKGLDVLLAAWQKLKKTKKFSLTIAGDGSYRSAVEADSSISYLGRLSAEGVSQAMRQAHLLVVPSICYENSPLTIVEAWSNDLLVLGSDLGGVSEALEKEEFLFETGNVNALVDKIKRLESRYDDIDLPKHKNFTEKNYLDKLAELVS